LKGLGLQPATGAKGGRYRRSLPLKPGVRFWATSRPRSREDMLGVQFFGEAVREGQLRAAELERRGFVRRAPQTGQITFAKPVPFAQGEEIDTAALGSVRRELEALLAREVSPGEEGRTPHSALSLREFMLASPLADLELDLSRPPGGWRPVDL